jgi:hypothetical protein
MAASMVRLLQAVDARDHATTLRCIDDLVFSTHESRAVQRATIDAILTSASTFPHDEDVIFGTLCAMTRAHAVTNMSATPLDVVTMVKQHVSSASIIGAALCLLLVIDGELPHVAEVTAQWMKQHPQHRSVAYHGAHVLLKVAGIEPGDLKKEYGTFGSERIDVAVVAGAVATSRIEVYVRGQAWNAFVLERLYPRLRH